MSGEDNRKLMIQKLKKKLVKQQKQLKRLQKKLGELMEKMKSSGLVMT